ncbi:DMT family transporter [Actibacterium sp. D379-3]
MIGELFAVFAALAFAVSGIAIAKSAATERPSGDNGAFLSVLLTATFSFLLWLLFSPPQTGTLSRPEWAAGIGFFLLAGGLATVIGRLAMFETVKLAGAINASILRRLVPFFATILAFVFLGEAISWLTAAGMAVILGSILVVIFEKAPAGAVLAGRQGLRFGQILGVASSLSYAASFVARKLGMSYIPDPFLGTWVGAVSGLIWYAGGAAWGGRYRDAVLHVFRDTRGWQLLAAVTMSVGQICQFTALRHADVATVSIIGAFEVFVSAFLAAYVFHTERKPSLITIAASVVAVCGVALVVLS